MPLPSSIRRTGGHFAALGLAVAGLAGQTQAADLDDQGRVRRAVLYLDARQDEWAGYVTAGRGAGADRTACVSCHTGVSYTLARPALRPFAPEPTPAPPERAMVAAVTLRDAHRLELDSPRFQLMYDFNDRKKVESRGTEAVLNALILARDDAAQGRTTPGAATRAALRHLWATQESTGDHTGAWAWLNFRLEPWEGDGSPAFGAALAAIAVGSSPGYLNGTLDDQATRGVTALRAYLRRRFPAESLFNRLWIVEAAATFDGLLSAEQRLEVAAQTLAARREDGGWALATFGNYKRVDGTTPATESDAYATALAVHALQRAGTPAARPELVQGLDWLRSHQQADGSWVGRSVNKERDPKTFVGRFMGDAATALAAQVLVEADPR